MFVIRRQLALRMQAGFIQHPPEKDDAAHLLRRVSQT
jgi:hypothetical protein